MTRVLVTGAGLNTEEKREISPRNLAELRVFNHFLSERSNSRRKDCKTQHYPVRFEDRVAFLPLDKLPIDVAGATKVLD